jgi:CHAT domain-containing protein
LTLRALPGGQPDREAFAGFGDPIFNLDQLNPQATDQLPLASRGADNKAVAVRGIRISQMGPLDSSAISSVGIDDLCRLPDTADEIIGIASSLGASLSTGVFLGKDASETRVKAEDLSRKRILAFATHALLPGDLDGLTQPALAFSSPAVTQQDEDGLLTVGEILTFKLDADLVVLSACDTGAGDGSGNEAVSGLGRAFFYSGARALLVTLWPVESTSANKLTTGLFRYRENTKEVSWARAQQKSILELMDTQGLRDNDGVLVARYAHPFFWGPFIVVGDSGAR